MRETVIATPNPPFQWVDVVAPEPPELAAIAAEFGFHAMSMEDCLDPWHLPKYERFGETTFIILRVFDERCASEAATVQELTRKIAVFFRPGLVVTIHRSDLPLVASARERFRGGNGGQLSEATLLGTLFNAALDSFEPPMDQAEDRVDALEEDLLNPNRQSPDLQAIHRLKRRVNVIKRLFWQTNAVLQKLVAASDRALPIFHDLKENAESYHYYADQLLDEINNLLSIQVALSSHRTNEVMRVLTVFSAFFLPLTFIVGVYGMNFDVMPELRLWWGYPAVLGLMVAVCLVIVWWFRHRGWWGRGGA